MVSAFSPRAQADPGAPDADDMLRFGPQTTPETPQTDATDRRRQTQTGAADRRRQTQTGAADRRHRQTQTDTDRYHVANRLTRESSPYLRQHADNPVDWHAWGEEAFARARAEDRPIFLSIGYSTCHWCHVMAHESFESDAVAGVLNAGFVPVKVDREERPDVDRVYMAFVQATTGAGGWPMSIWLTPDLKPFYGGTYFPPTSRWGRPGFVDILNELSRAWRDERPRVIAAADVLLERLRDAAAEGSRLSGLAGADTRSSVAGAEAIDTAVAAFRSAFDPRHGGFGDAPKFPRPSELVFLLRAFARDGQEAARTMAVETLRAMALGGMRDHIGGGFHRYSVDARWRVPHFEKMLYDQAQLVLACLEAAQAAGDGFYASVAEDTLDYVRRELTHEQGGFFSAEDADSVPPEHAGEPGAHPTEGAFYIWSQAEIDALFDESDAHIVRLRFGVEENGNAPSDPQDEFGTKNLLYTASSIEEIATRTGLAPDVVVDTLGRARPVMFRARAQRPRPHLDDKILASWNGLMIAACARAGRVIGGLVPDAGAEYAGVAERAARFVRAQMWNAETGTLWRRWRDGEAGIAAYCEDYACVVWGALELFQTTGRAEWLDWALELQARQDALFWDEADGGWFSTTGDDESVLLRLKEDYDGAEPAASSIGVRNLIDLGHLVADGDFAARAERTLARFGPRIGEAARAVPCMLGNLVSWHAGLSQIVIVGPKDREDTRALQHVLSERYLPFTIVVPVEPGEAQAALAQRLPWIGPMIMIDERATAYVCRRFACEQPVTSPEALAELARSPS
jgi:uncharacterized protein